MLFQSNQELIDKAIQRILSPKEGAENSAAENYFSRLEKEEIFNVAASLNELMSRGDMLIILGQSPAYIAKVLEYLNEEKYQLIHIPFSGVVDFIDIERANAQSAQMNFLHPERQKYWRELMQERGYDPLEAAQRKIFILDLKNTGRGISSFIRQLVLWNTEIGNEVIPDFNIISLNHSRTAFAKNQIISSKKIKNGVPTFLPDGQALWGRFSFVIDEYLVNMSASLVSKFDKVEGEARLVPSFQARFWVPEASALFAIYPRPYAQAIAEDLVNEAKIYFSP